MPPRLEALRGFCLEAAKHYSGKVGAWEVWNEPDNNGIFFNGTAREFYDVMAEAYKALKEGSGGKATVLQGAMCFKDVSPFARDLFTFGAGKYTDAFNWHSYEPPESYEQILSHYRQDCHLGGMPTWLTEAGIFLGTSPDGELSEDAAHQQCEYVPKSVARSLACGNTKHFFFLLPHRNEGGACLGALRKDLTPNPSAVALSAAARVLGSCKYSRTVELEGITADKRRTHAVAIFFDSPTGGERVVTWADERCEVGIRIDGAVANKNIKALNMFGGPYIVDTGADRVSLQLGTQPAYILIPKLTPVPRQ